MIPSRQPGLRHTIDTLELAAREHHYAGDCLDRLARCLRDGHDREATRYGELYATAMGEALERIEGLVPAELEPRPAA